MGDETVRLTYSELAKTRGITLAAARRMTLRHKWPKQIGNDGLSRVLVPASALNAGTGIVNGNGTSAAPGDGNGAARHAGNGDAPGSATGTGNGDTPGD